MMNLLRARGKNFKLIRSPESGKDGMTSGFNTTIGRLDRKEKDADLKFVLDLI